MEAVERRLAVRVEPDVLVADDVAAITVEGNAELREVERPAAGPEHDLVDAGAGDLLGGGHDAERAHLGLWPRQERLDPPSDVPRREERLVAPGVDGNGGGTRLSDLPPPIRAPRMISGRPDSGEAQAT